MLRIRGIGRYSYIHQDYHMARKTLLSVVAVVLLVVCAEASAQISFTASVDKNVVALGDTIVLTLTLSGGTDLPEPELPPLIGFDLLGEQGTTRSIRVINSETTYSVSRQYVLAPQEEGDFVISAATLRYRSEVYRTEPITVKVVPASQLPQAAVPSIGQNLLATLTADKTEVFLGEQVNLYFRVYAREVQVVSEANREGPGTEGFIKHELSARQFRTTRDGLIYDVIELPMVLFPIKRGEMTIPPVSLTGQVKVPVRGRASSSFPGFDSFFDRYTLQPYKLVTDAVKILVKPLPAAGKPDSFSGSVGNYSLDVFSKPAQLKVGEPITLTMKIAGSGNLDAVSAPIASDIQNFKTYDPEITTNIVEKEPSFKGEKTFETILVPQRSGRQVIQNVRFSFFDPEKKSYVTLAKGPFEFNVLPAPIEPMKRVVEVQTGPGKTEIKVVGEDIGPIFTELGNRSRPESMTGLAFYVPFAAPPVAYAVMLAVVTRKRRLTTDVLYARKKRATRDARRRLALATRALKEGDNANFCTEITKAITGFVADRFGLSSAGLTSGDVKDHLEAAGVPQDLVKRTTDLLESCDYGRFAAAHAHDDMARMLNGARDILSELQRSLSALHVSKTGGG